MSTRYFCLLFYITYSIASANILNFILYAVPVRYAGQSESWLLASQEDSWKVLELAQEESFILSQVFHFPSQLFQVHLTNSSF